MGVTTAIGAGLTGLGVGAETAAAAAPVLFDVGAGAAGGAALGGGEAALTGGNVGQGLLHGGESGAITGGGIGAGEAALGGTIGETAGGALGGAAGGALGQSVTGGNALTGAIGGGIAGGLAGSAATPSAPTGGGAGASAASSAAPSGISPDVGLPSSTDQTLFSPNTSTTTVGSGSVGTQGIGGTVTQNQGMNNFLTNLGAENASAAPVNDALSPAVVAADNTAGAPGTGVLNQQGTLANLTGSTSPVPQSSSLASAAGAANAAGGATPSSISQLISNPSLANAGNVLTQNPGAAIGAAGLGYEAIAGAKNSAAEKSLEAQAGQENAQGKQLESYLASGTLPPGLQAGVNQATQSVIANIKSRYAAQGASGSSAEQQDIANAQAQAQATGAQMAMQLMNTGISETGMASQLYKQIMDQQTATDTGLSTAISNFASAAAGGGNIGKGGEFKITPSGS